jgi:hypothetical protein
VAEESKAVAARGGCARSVSKEVRQCRLCYRRLGVAQQSIKVPECCPKVKAVSAWCVACATCVTLTTITACITCCNSAGDPL